jgi:UDP-N-acetyl-L-fucosamine synthase
MVGLNPERILQGLQIISNQKRGNERTVMTVSDYSKSNVSDKVLRIIASYTDYINRNVWGE